MPSPFVSKADKLTVRIWICMIILMTIAAVVAALMPTVASVPGLGFPCLFANIVDYHEFVADGHTKPMQFTPMLFYEVTEFYFVIYVLVFIFLSAAGLTMYGIKVVVAVVRENTYVRVGRDATVLFFSPALIFMFTVIMWVYQCFIHLLAFKAFSLAAVCFTVYYWTLMVACAVLSTRATCYKTFVNDDAFVKRIGGNYTVLVFRTKIIFANLTYFALGISTLMWCLIMEYLVAHTIKTQIVDLLIGGLCVYFLLHLGLTCLIELYLSRFTPALFGYHVGNLLGEVLLCPPLWRYGHKFKAVGGDHPNKLYGVLIALLSVAAIISMIMTAIRALRFARGRRSKLAVDVQELSVLQSYTDEEGGERNELLERGSKHERGDGSPIPPPRPPAPSGKRKPSLTPVKNGKRKRNAMNGDTHIY